MSVSVQHLLTQKPTDAILDMSKVRMRPPAVRVRVYALHGARAATVRSAR